MNINDYLTEEERRLSRGQSPVMREIFRSLAASRALVAEKDKALAIIAGMPCLTELLGEDNPDDPCGCARCQAKPALALTEREMME